MIGALIALVVRNPLLQKDISFTKRTSNRSVECGDYENNNVDQDVVLIKFICYRQCACGDDGASDWDYCTQPIGLNQSQLAL